MGKKEKFIKIPRSIDKDPRLQPWTKKKGVNNREVIWVVERMIARLYFEEDPLEIDDLINGLHNNHLSYLFLKDMVLHSGFFHVEGEHIKYDWERFAQNPGKKQSDDESDGAEADNENRSCVAGESPVNRSLTHARTSSSANRRVQYIETETETENIPPLKKEKEKKPKEDYESIIRKIVMEYDFREGELDGWTGSSMEDKKEALTQYLIGMLNWQNSQRAERVGNNLGIENYKARWRDIVIAYVKQIDSSGYLSKMFNPTKVKLYLDIFASKADKTADTYQAGLQMLKEMERMRKAEIAVEKQRFPFEDYDPERGTRYVGNDLIPWDAPPRPDAVSTWDEEDCCWRSPAEVEERAQRSHARFIEMLKTYNESHGKPGGAELPG